MTIGNLRSEAAKSERRKQIDFRDILRLIIKEKPKAEEAVHRSIFRRTLKQDDYEEYLNDVIDRMFSLEYNTAKRAVFPPNRRKLTKATLAARKTKQKNAQMALDAAVEAKIASRLLDAVMPNGKKLRDCTGGECSRFGGWLLEIADRVGSDQLVGAALNEKQVREIYDR